MILNPYLDTETVIEKHISNYDNHVRNEYIKKLELRIEKLESIIYQLSNESYNKTYNETNNNNTNNSGKSS